MPSALVLLAAGAEEMEAIISADVLRRGGVSVTIAGVAGPDAVTCSRDVVVRPDAALADVQGEEYDVVLCPGGMGGANALAESAAVGGLLKRQEARGGRLACICAAPIALASHGLAAGSTLTSHPSVRQRLVDAGYKYSEERVVVDGQLVTSRGPGTAFEFALKLVELLMGKDTKESIMGPMLLPDAKY